LLWDTGLLFPSETRGISHPFAPGIRPERARKGNAPNARRYHFDQATSWARGIAGDLGFFTGAGPVSDSRDPKRA
jgi:hypothetical protein